MKRFRKWTDAYEVGQACPSSSHVHADPHVVTRVDIENGTVTCMPYTTSTDRTVHFGPPLPRS